MPASSEVDYGQASRYILTAVDGNLVTAHSLTLQADPGEPYDFVVKGIDGAGNSASSSNQTFHTKGVVLTVSVVDPQNRPVKGAVISYENSLRDTVIEKISATTDKNGHATLTNLPVGPKTPANLIITASFHGKVLSSKIQIQPIANAGVAQNTKIIIKSSNTTVLTIIGLGAGLSIIALFYGGHTLRSRMAAAAELSRHFPKLPGSTPPPSAGAGNIITPQVTPVEPGVKPEQYKNQ